MASAAAMAAIQSAVSAAWSHTAIVLPNSGITQLPADGSALLFLEFPVSFEGQKSLGAPGANIWREEGVFRLVLLIQSGIGLDPWPGRIDMLRAALRGQSLLSGALKTFEANPPVSAEGGPDGQAYEISFGVRYWFDVIG